MLFGVFPSMVNSFCIYNIICNLKPLVYLNKLCTDSSVNTIADIFINAAPGSYPTDWKNLLHIRISKKRNNEKIKGINIV